MCVWSCNIPLALRGLPCDLHRDCEPLKVFNLMHLKIDGSPGYWSDQGEAILDSELNPQYKLFQSPLRSVPTDGCQICPSNLYCPGGQELPRPFPSHFMITNSEASQTCSATRDNDISCSFLCKPTIKCLGGLPGDQCGYGYRNTPRGRGCSKCARVPDRFYRISGGYCEMCTKFDPASLVFLSATSAGMLYLLAKYSGLVRGLASPKIFMNFAQTIAMFRYYRNIKWPEVVKQFMRMMQQVVPSIDLFQLECVADVEDFMITLVFLLAVPMVAAGLLGLLLLANNLMLKDRKEQDFR